MRTTVTIDDDVAAALKRRAHQEQTSFRATLNAVLRRGLSGQDPTAAPTPFRVVPFSATLRPGIDPTKLNQLIDDLEVEDYLEEASLDGSAEP